MELVETLEIDGEEREIADAYAREQCAANAEGIDGINSNLNTLEFGEVAGGKNLWDEQWKIGVYTESDGIFSPSFDYFCSKNKIKVKPNTIYRFVSPEIKYFIYKYDVNGNYIGRITKVENIFSTDNNVEYIQFVMEREYGTTYNHDIAIIEGTSGTYEPYIPSVKMLADEVKAQNDSLADYGLNNLYDGLTRNGYYSGAGAFISNNGAIANVNPYKCNAGDIITIKTDITRTDSRIVFLNSSGGAVSYVDNDFDKVSVPANATSFVFNFSPTNFNHIGVYINNAIDELKNDLSEKLKVISVSLSDVMVSAMSSTTVDLPQEYIDAGYVIANILSKPDTGLSYTTGSETSIIIRNNTNSAVAFAPTTTVKVLIAKIG